MLSVGVTSAVRCRARVLKGGLASDRGGSGAKAAATHGRMLALQRDTARDSATVRDSDTEPQDSPEGTTCGGCLAPTEATCRPSSRPCWKRRRADTSRDFSQLQLGSSHREAAKSSTASIAASRRGIVNGFDTLALESSRMAAPAPSGASAI
jgi:hypothetical protein